MKLLVVFIVAIVFACCNNEIQKQLIIEDKFKSSIPQDSAHIYFPTDSLFFVSDNRKKNVDSFVKEWYSQVLYGFQEPDLYNHSGEGEAIRLLWLPSFGNPIVVRINNFNDTVYANIKEQKEMSYEEGHPKILTDTIITLDKKKWKEILSALETNNFWQAKVEDTSSAKDGIPWLLECRLYNKYYHIDRWDVGDLTSRDLNLYAKELVDIANDFVQMKSRKSFVKKLISTRS
jgi:hypothetical protein